MDVRSFPVYSIPLDTLELRVKAAAVPSGKTEHDTLLAVQRDLTKLVQHAHQIGYYTAESEARLALGEVESRLSSATASAHLSAFANEEEKRGFLLYARQAGKIQPLSDSLALNKPGR